MTQKFDAYQMVTDRICALLEQAMTTNSVLTMWGRGASRSMIGPCRIRK